jgi:uncharacterized protein (TIGR02145 family)
MKRKNKILIYSLYLIYMTIMLSNIHAFGQESNTTVIDIDGNAYHTVTIGTQVWMVENLKVTHYQNGDPIPYSTSGSPGVDLDIEAYSSYDNKRENADIYGYLYNGYAVIDSRNICPVGWHIPDVDEWKTLINYLGGEKIAGRKMKEAGTIHWDAPNIEADNSSGFTALPGGRNDFKYSDGLGSFGVWWIPGRYDISIGTSAFTIVNVNNYSTNSFLSVRCVRNKDYSEDLKYPEKMGNTAQLQEKKTEIKLTAQKQEVIKDFDGNIYKTIKIGNQEWMAEDLRTTHFNDGTVIKLVADEKIRRNPESIPQQNIDSLLQIISELKDTITRIDELSSTMYNIDLPDAQKGNSLEIGKLKSLIELSSYKNEISKIIPEMIKHMPVLIGAMKQKVYYSKYFSGRDETLANWKRQPSTPKDFLPRVGDSFEEKPNTDATDFGISYIRNIFSPIPSQIQSKFYDKLINNYIELNYIGCIDYKIKDEVDQFGRYTGNRTFQGTFLLKYNFHIGAFSLALLTGNDLGIKKKKWDNLMESYINEANQMKSLKNDLAKYGKLYNWDTSTSNHNICPVGWHIPTDDEWTTLEFFLGGSRFAGGKMKEAESNHWFTPNTKADNSSGFSALPAGFLSPNGTFSGIGKNSAWWAITESSESFAWGRELYFKDAILHHTINSKNSSFCIRCIKDNAMSSATQVEEETYTDSRDGKTYKAIKIGTQTWTSKNLDVSTFRNGDPIQETKTKKGWDNAAKKGEPACCYYEINSVNGDKYGKLYNWFAVNDSRGLAPAGWHVPSDAEWTTLTTYLGGEGVAGRKLKETGTSHWSSSYTGGINETGFTAVPGGYCYKGTFNGVGESGYWWSSTEYSSIYAWCRKLSYNYSKVSKFSDNFKHEGYSVRCVKD